MKTDGEVQGRLTINKFTVTTLKLSDVMMIMSAGALHFGDN